MKIRTLILMAIVVILAGCSGSILQKNTEINFPSNFANTSWSGDEYSATFSSTGYTITRNSDSARITNISRYDGRSLNIIKSDDYNTVQIVVTNNYTTVICTDEFKISDEGGIETLTIYMENVCLDGTTENIGNINNAILTREN